MNVYFLFYIRMMFCIFVYETHFKLLLLIGNTDFPDSDNQHHNLQIYHVLF